MLRIFGNRTRLCDGISRREAMRIGGLSLFGGLTLPRLLQARSARSALHVPRAKSVVLLNLFGGPPQMDTFDPKPHGPEASRGEFRAIATSNPDVQVCELLPKCAQLMDRVTLIRTYSHRYNSHNPYNVYTGFDEGIDSDNFFARRTDHPSIGSVCSYLDVGAADVPRYVIMPSHPGFSQSLRRSGPYAGYLGSKHDPLFTTWKKAYEGEGGEYLPAKTVGAPVLSSFDALPDVTADRLDHRRSLLDQLDRSVAATNASGRVANLGYFQQQGFDLLTSPKARQAFDLTREPDAAHDRYGRNLWGSSMLMARRLVEAGSTFVSVHWEGGNGNHWDMHENNFGMCRILVPILDQIVSALILDLEERGLLDSTLVIVMGEMGRTPRINGRRGRDHWPQCGFVFLAGGGAKRGFVFGRTDDQAASPLDCPVSAGDLAATIYDLLGVDHTLTVNDLSGRPVHIAHGGEPVREIFA